MKRKFIAVFYMAVLTCALATGCAQESTQTEETVQEGTVSEEETGSEEADQETETEAEETEQPETAVVLEDGVYIADFDTDSSMFHVSEAMDGKGTLTVENGEMTIHISLTSKNIVNLFYGLTEDAQKDGAELIEPTTDSVTYSDGITEEVYGFDVPVPALDVEYDVAIIGTKGTWYDHKVSVSNPEMLED